MGNLRISVRYFDSPASTESDGRAATVDILNTPLTQQYAPAERDACATRPVEASSQACFRFQSVDVGCDRTVAGHSGGYRQRRARSRRPDRRSFRSQELTAT